MAGNTTDDVEDCHRQAAECSRLAAKEPIPKLKQVYLDMRDRWLELALSYEFPEVLSRARAPRQHS
jgi:hypothetical protein